jgi:hypothetical protein
MGDLADRRMTLAEFLVWDDGTDTRYELIRGAPRDHGAGLSAARPDRAQCWSRDRAHTGISGPCRVYDQTGVVLSVLGDDRYYIPDLT